jgi:MFS family permease
MSTRHTLDPNDMTADPNPGRENTSPAPEPWGMVAACAVVMAMSAGVWYSASVFFLALLKEFQHGYAYTAGVYSLFTVCYGISGMISGGLVDRVGSRRSILLGGVLVPIALTLNSLAPSLGWMYLSQGILVAFGMATCGYVPVSALLTRCFHRHRGLAIGTASAGVGLGILVVVPLTQLVIEQYGWRLAYVVLAVLNGIVTIPVALFLLPDRSRESVAGPPMQPGGAPGPVPEGPSGWSSLPAALTTREFWLVTATFSLINGPTQLILTHHVAHMVEAGQSKMFVASIVGLVGLASIPGKILWGYLSDRWWLETVYATGVFCLVGSILLLTGIAPDSPIWSLYVYATLMGFGYAVSPTLTPILGARFFAGPHFGAILGGLSVFYHTGGAVGVWLAGYSHDLTGNYQVAFAASILCAFAGLTCAWLAGPRRVRVPGGALRPQPGEIVTEKR